MNKTSDVPVYFWFVVVFISMAFLVPGTISLNAPTFSDLNMKDTTQIFLF